MLFALATLLMGAPPVPIPEVTDAAGVKDRMGVAVVLVGQVERVPMGKGGKEWHGTAVVLDDDTIVYVSYGAPPAGWEKLVGARVKVEGGLRPSLSEHEQSLLAPHLRNPAAPKKDERALGKLVGSRVRLSGTARDAKGGAVLLVGDSPLYLAGLGSWPAEAHGKLVAVGGTLVDRQYLPEAKKNSKGEWSQGAEGSQLVLEAPVWRVLSVPEPEPKK